MVPTPSLRSSPAILVATVQAGHVALDGSLGQPMPILLCPRPDAPRKILPIILETFPLRVRIARPQTISRLHILPRKQGLRAAGGGQSPALRAVQRLQINLYLAARGMMRLELAILSCSKAPAAVARSTAGSATRGTNAGLRRSQPTPGSITHLRSFPLNVRRVTVGFGRTNVALRTPSH